MGINSVVISGNLTRDAEVRSTASGLYVLTVGVAVTDRRKNQDTGEWEDHPNFFDCTMFGSRADSLKKYLVKGTKVVVAGRLRWSQWERDGQKRSKVDVIVEDIDFMTRAGFARAQGGSANGAAEGACAPGSTAATGFAASSAASPYAAQALAPQQAGGLSELDQASRPLIDYAQTAQPPASASPAAATATAHPTFASSSGAASEPRDPGAADAAAAAPAAAQPNADVTGLYDEEIPF